MQNSEDKTRAIGQRGKTAEKQVKDFLEARSQHDKEFDYERNYDARSAGGRFPSRAGDFTLYHSGEHGLIEVKEVAHDFRLPQKNFPFQKHGALLKRRWAGGHIAILVYHSTTKLWRHPDFDFFLKDPRATSWVLTGFPTYDTVSDVMEAL